MSFRRALPSLFLFLAGCAGTADPRGYPSLARREIESVNGFTPGPAAPSAQAPAEPAPVALAPVPVDASETKDLARKIADYAAQVSRGTKGFDGAYPSVAATVRAASGAAPLTESWSLAQVGIGTLEAARNEAVTGLANLDRLYIDRMNGVAQGVTTGGVDEINAERLKALAAVDAENDKIDALKDILSKP